MQKYSVGLVHLAGITALKRVTSVPHRTVILLLFGLFLSGCSTVGYYSQIVSGHMRIVLGKRPLAEVVADESINDETKHSLQVAQKARRFAIDELGLPNNESYTSFYDTGKEHVTWNVVAAEEFSVDPATWCFPIAGCVSYRGYYAEEDANAYAQNLAGEGFDVTVGGATAYSTLGWFKDPLLNTMLARSDYSLVSLLFHELAHQQLYVGDDSTFNESFASFVEREGFRQWMEQERKNSVEENQNEDTATLLARRQQRREEFILLLSRTRDDLETLYDSSIEEEAMRSAKAARFSQMRAEYSSLKKSWDGYEGFDRWFERDLNNARLVSVATYNDYIPAFGEMFKQSGSSFAEFFTTAHKVSKLPADERTQIMQELLLKASAVATQ